MHDDRESLATLTLGGLDLGLQRDREARPVAAKQQIIRQCRECRSRIVDRQRDNPVVAQRLGKHRPQRDLRLDVRYPAARLDDPVLDAGQSARRIGDRLLRLLSLGQLLVGRFQRACCRVDVLDGLCQQPRIERGGQLREQPVERGRLPGPLLVLRPTGRLDPRDAALDRLPLG